MADQLRFYIVDSFTRFRFQGNPAGVVISDSALDEELMFKIAAELHLETAFLWPLSQSDSRIASRVRTTEAYSICYYTHLARIPLCGHDTIAAGVVLLDRGVLSIPGAAGSGSTAPSHIVFRSDVGELPVEVRADASIGMRQTRPKFEMPSHITEVLSSLGVGPQQVSRIPSRVVSTGTPFLFIGLDSARSIDHITPDQPALSKALDRLGIDGLVGVYVWTDDRAGMSQSIYGRCFAPGAGLPEDPVTGSASGALGAHLFDSGLLRSAADGIVTMQTTQGRAMGRPGHADVTLIVSSDQVSSVSVAGHAIIAGEGVLRL